MIYENLISINKVYVQNENLDYKLRHDWNSLLYDHKLLFKSYSKDYYPNADDYVKYLKIS